MKYRNPEIPCPRVKRVVYDNHADADFILSLVIRVNCILINKREKSKAAP